MVRPRAVEERDSGDSSVVLYHTRRNTWALYKSVSGRYWTVSDEDAVMWLLRSDCTPPPEVSDALENLEI